MITETVGSESRLIAGVCAMLLAAAFPSGEPAAAHRLESLDVHAAIDRVTEASGELGIPGTAIALVGGGRVLFADGTGSSGSREVTARSPFLLGSTTMSFTAMAVLQLVESGALDLDSPVVRYLGWFRTANGELSRKITVAQLLHHTSGLSASHGLRGLDERGGGAEALERRARDLARISLGAAPGARYEYSNSNYVVLGALIQEVAGMPYEDYVRRRIFEPIGMTGSYFPTETANTRAQPTGHRFWFGLPVAARGMPFVRGYVSAGYAVSCAEDLARYLLCLANGGEIDDQRVLSPQSVELLIRPAATIGPGSDYAMGWKVKTRGGERTVWHSGDLPDFHSFLALLPEERLGLVLLQNAGSGLRSPAMHAVGWHGVELLSGAAPQRTARRRAWWLPLVALAGIVTAQIIGLARSVLHLRGLNRSPPPGGAGKIRAAFRVVLYLVSALALVIGVPRLAGSPLGVILLYVPDLAMLLLLSAALAALAAVLQTLLCGRLRRSPHRQSAPSRRVAQTQ